MGCITTWQLTEIGYNIYLDIDNIPNVPWLVDSTSHGTTAVERRSATKRIIGPWIFFKRMQTLWLTNSCLFCSVSILFLQHHVTSRCFWQLFSPLRRLLRLCQSIHSMTNDKVELPCYDLVALSSLLTESIPLSTPVKRHLLTFTKSLEETDSTSQWQLATFPSQPHVQLALLVTILVIIGLVSTWQFCPKLQNYGRQLISTFNPANLYFKARNGTYKRVPQGGAAYVCLFWTRSFSETYPHIPPSPGGHCKWQ